MSWKRVCKFLHPSCFLPSFLPLLPPQLLIAVQSFLEHRLYHRAIFRLGPFTIDRDKRVHRNLSSFLSSRISSLSDRKQKLNIYDINGSLENGLPCVDPYTLVSFPHPTGIRYLDFFFFSFFFAKSFQYPIFFPSQEISSPSKTISVDKGKWEKNSKSRRETSLVIPYLSILFFF